MDDLKCGETPAVITATQSLYEKVPGKYLYIVPAEPKDPEPIDLNSFLLVPELALNTPRIWCSSQK